MNSEVFLECVKFGALARAQQDGRSWATVVDVIEHAYKLSDASDLTIEPYLDEPGRKAGEFLDWQYQAPAPNPEIEKPDWLLGLEDAIRGRVEESDVEG